LGQPKKNRGYNEGLLEIVSNPFVELLGHVSMKCFVINLSSAMTFLFG